MVFGIIIMFKWWYIVSMWGEYINNLCSFHCFASFSIKKTHIYSRASKIYLCTYKNLKKYVYNVFTIYCVKVLKNKINFTTFINISFYFILLFSNHIILLVFIHDTRMFTKNMTCYNKYYCFSNFKSKAVIRKKKKNIT